MKKQLFLFTVACVLSISAFSQSFQHGAGIGLYFDNMVPDNVGVGSAFTYNPRINFTETEATSLSVGIPLTVGYIQNAYSVYNGSSLIQTATGFMVNAPVIVNFNFGGGSSKKSKGRIGGFIGAGYGFHYISSRDYYAYDESNGVVVKSVGGSSFGPAANGGMRIAVGRKRTKNIEIKLSYYAGTSQNKVDLYGVGAAFNF
ncbi:hypothetical protein SAMN05428988_4780 [Chitinophaga sp. YR573]|uniref:hypothetical protein n=1 Tax=Chitinophaga sp. YR573 TaxID=1881040 RepID=UPI0008B32710|nr:hypothetical protein [Chitinophaga sp. YR573]SEW38113.1 hypothetical protein SAMN05428988_4780 [Chitinophaga sp. YR573]